LIRAGTSVGANYRAACRARSTKDFVNKLGVVIEESDESGYWMELIIEAKLMSDTRVVDLMKEADELTAIFTASHKTASMSLRQSNQKSEIRNQR
jgi:four helix bundle protein